MVGFNKIQLASVVATPMIFQVVIAYDTQFGMQKMEPSLDQSYKDGLLNWLKTLKPQHQIYKDFVKEVDRIVDEDLIKSGPLLPPSNYGPDFENYDEFVFDFWDVLMQWRLEIKEGDELKSILDSQKNTDLQLHLMQATGTHDKLGYYNTLGVKDMLDKTNKIRKEEAREYVEYVARFNELKDSMKKKKHNLSFTTYKDGLEFEDMVAFANELDTRIQSLKSSKVKKMFMKLKQKVNRCCVPISLAIANQFLEWENDEEHFMVGGLAVSRSTLEDWVVNGGDPVKHNMDVTNYGFSGCYNNEPLFWSTWKEWLLQTRQHQHDLQQWILEKGLKDYMRDLVDQLSVRKVVEKFQHQWGKGSLARGPRCPTRYVLTKVLENLENL